ncbi:MAG: 6-carboxytetrahydropterin synthase QueD [Actinobacteria bacterium]|nr:6-carboxytetrahydropterin synthase QueD [Actinomycetota bacterium]
MEIFREYTFEAAHRLPHVPEGHKCARLHGHSFRVAVHVEGPVGHESGWVMDFADVDAVFATILDQLDHRYLNEIDGLANPTSEHLAAWIWERLEATLPQLTKIVVSETCTSGAVLRRLDH